MRLTAQTSAARATPQACNHRVTAPLTGVAGPSSGLAVASRGCAEVYLDAVPSTENSVESGAPDRIRTFGLCLGEKNGIAAPRYSLTEALESEETTGVWFERERVYGCPRRTSVARTALRPGGRAAPGLASMRDLGK